MNIDTFLKSASDIPGRTAIQLLAFRLSLPESTLRAWPGKPLPSHVETQLAADLNALRQGTPSAYVFGEVPFLDWEFKIDERALIPRPETEDLCHKVVRRYSHGNPPLQVLDLCCGSGVMGLSMALSFPLARVHLTDISQGALSLAAENRDRLQLTDRVTLSQGDLWQAVPRGTRYDLVICNPPYVASNDEVQAEVLRFEPHIALYSGDEGMEHVKRILGRLFDFLEPQGMAFFELGHNHKDLLSSWIGNSFDGDRFSWEKDPFGVPRFLIYDGREREDV